VEVPSKKVPFFKAGKELRQLVDNHAKVEEEKES
jgi:nucleoid DNA-binding protein